MLTQRVEAITRFTRSDATRLVISTVILVLALTAVQMRFFGRRVFYS